MTQGWQKLRAELSLWRVGAIPGLTVITGVVVLRFFGFLQPLELMVFDGFLRSRPAEPIDERIVIVGITDDDIHRIGTYPIPDRDLSTIIQRVQSYQPNVIGLDFLRDVSVPPGRDALLKALQSPNLIAIEKALPEQGGFSVAAPPSLPAERIGFSDVLPDRDGRVRRWLLGASTPKKQYRFSLALQLARSYLSDQGLSLENGVRDRAAMRFSQTELTRFQPNFGSYVGEDAGGNQILLHPRAGRNPFRRVSWQDIQSGSVNPDWIRGRIVLIGLTAVSVKYDVVNSNAIPSPIAGLVNGVEMHAHATSQILSAALDDRPLLHVWSDEWEYSWIIAWGLVGIGLGRFARSPSRILFGVAAACLGLIGSAFGAILIGWWIPLVPAAMVLVLNGAGLAAATFYRYEQNLRERLRDRQAVIDHMFTTIHNGPLQTLAKMLREVQMQDDSSQQRALLPELQHLNQELRTVYEVIQREALEQETSLQLDSNAALDLQAPLHTILYEVYLRTMERELPYFQTIRTRIVKFEPMSDRGLSLSLKRSLCRFLEEALCNVGKYAINTTRITVICAEENGKQVIRVVDNGKTHNDEQSHSAGMGTQQAKTLARQLRGTFQRLPNEPTGMRCELSWVVRKFWF
ncbi:CHASE2 domain-containing protein [Leptolyngbya sp. FACHB-36]|uniref:sensor histidine kinase n=1 Tax=Leptolyngbya sp. FACHB-36 TaxID=2692808 RepID=UPI00168119E2|nr:CHASE2 domain-containing protein [Leptolyngbya sp. FACHB-36]MBD2019054.1 CHASE2 domain-containing protein [Leptolyngbya sp. FACHB-36]